MRVGPLHSLADRRGVGSVVLAALAAHAVGGDELGGHQLDAVAVGGEQPGPVVRAGAGFDADGAGRQGGHHFAQLGARDLGLAQLHRACGVHPVQCKDALGEIDTDVDNGHGLPLPSELMRVRTSHRGTSLPVAAPRLERDGEVPFIR